MSVDSVPGHHEEYWNNPQKLYNSELSDQNVLRGVGVDPFSLFNRTMDKIRIRYHHIEVFL
jgi:hypothetical protein